MTKRAAFRQDDVKRAVNGVVAAGLSVCRIEVESGRIVVFVGEPSNDRANPLDKLYG